MIIHIDLMGFDVSHNGPFNIAVIYKPTAMIQIGVIAPIPLSSGSFGKMADNTKIRHSLIIFLVAISTVYSVSADSIKGCGGFVEVYHSFLLSARKSSAEARFSLIQYL